MVNREKYMRKSGGRGGYHFEDAGDKAGGVWTPEMRAEEFARRRDADAAAAATAEANMQAAIGAINGDDTLTQQQKVSRLGTLTASGYSEREFTMLWDAQAAAAALL